MPHDDQTNDYEVLKSHRLLNLTTAVAGFYLLEELSTKLPARKVVNEALQRGEPLDPSRAKEKLIEDFFEEKDTYDARLARVMFDYLVLACVGEARHAVLRCVSHYVVGMGATRGKGRGEMWESALGYDPRNLLKKCGELFEYEWRGSFGGRKWKTIAGSALRYYEYPPSVFIDTIVDLTHNGSLAFDKGILVKVGNIHTYRSLLNAKRDGGVFFAQSERGDDAPGWDYKVPFACYMLAKRAVTLGYAEAIRPSISPAEWDETPFPPTVQWGESTITLRKKRRAA